MAGLDTILRHIDAASQLRQETVLAQAREQAAAIEAEAAAQRETREAQTAAALSAKLAQAAALADTAASKAARQTLLAARGGILADTVDAVREALGALPVAAYFDTLLALAERYALPREEGVLLLSEADAARAPVGFAAALGDMLTLGTAEAGQLRQGGCVLVYGDIELNCGFDALIEDARDALRERMAAILFA